MMDDNFYKASSERIVTGQTSENDRLKKAKLVYEREASIIGDTIERFRELAQYYESVNSIREEADPENFMREVSVNKRVASIIKQELSRLEKEVKVLGKK